MTDRRDDDIRDVVEWWLPTGHHFLLRSDRLVYRWRSGEWVAVESLPDSISAARFARDMAARADLLVRFLLAQSNLLG